MFVVDLQSYMNYWGCGITETEKVRKAKELLDMWDAN